MDAGRCGRLHGGRGTGAPRRRTGGLWVVRSHHIDYKRQTFLGDDRIEVRTWIADCRLVSSRRRYEFHRISPEVPEDAGGKSQESGSLLARKRTGCSSMRLPTSPNRFRQTCRRRMLSAQRRTWGGVRGIQSFLRSLAASHRDTMFRDGCIPGTRVAMRRHRWIFVGGVLELA